jgi:hypothetical protein
MRRLVIPATVILALIAASAADASGLNLGGRNPRHGSTKHATRLVGKLKGGALQVRNIGGGPAFTFMTTGLLGGTITVGKGGDGVRPFTTNATGVATGLNADRLDGHHASDFLLASNASAFLTSGGPIDATTLQGKHATDFLAADGKAANANLLDGLDSTAFLGVHGTADNASQLQGHPASDFLASNGTAANSSQLQGHPASDFLASNGTAADSSQLGGHAPAFYEPSANHVSLSPATVMDKGDATATVGSAPGFSLTADCSDASGGTQIDLSLDNTGTADAFVGISGGGGNTSTTVTSAAGAVNVFSDTTFGALPSGGVLPYTVSIVTDAGIYQGVLTIGTGILSHDCFISGSLSS